MSTEAITKIKGSIRAFINDNFLLGADVISYADSDSFIARGIIDSTGVLELVSYIQEAFGIIMDDQDLAPENLDSVENVACYITRKAGNAGK